MRITNVRINGIKNSVGFDFETVCLSWKVRESKGKKQENARAEVSLDKNFEEILYSVEEET